VKVNIVDAFLGCNKMPINVDRSGSWVHEICLLAKLAVEICNIWKEKWTL